MSRPVSRRKLAELVGVHPDSVSRNLTEGLACAVAEWDTRGRAVSFDTGLALRFWAAWTCPSKLVGFGARACAACEFVLEDCSAVAEHLIEKRHGVGGCRECTAPGELAAPCRGRAA